MRKDADIAATADGYALRACKLKAARRRFHLFRGRGVTFVAVEILRDGFRRSERRKVRHPALGHQRKSFP